MAGCFNSGKLAILNWLNTGIIIVVRFFGRKMQLFNDEYRIYNVRLY
jgi:hypothetical protein